MKTTELYCRDIFSLSNHEIISLVDFIYDDVNLDRLTHYLQQERSSLKRSFNYRKIEVHSSYYEWAYIIKVTYGFEDLSRKVTTGFLFSMEGGPGDEQFYERDVAIQSIEGFFKTMEGIIWERGVTDQFGIEVDFSCFRVYFNKFQEFARKELRLWDTELPQDKYDWNVKLRDMMREGHANSFVIQELNQLDYERSPDRAE